MVATDRYKKVKTNKKKACVGCFFNGKSGVISCENARKHGEISNCVETKNDRTQSYIFIVNDKD